MLTSGPACSYRGVRQGFRAGQHVKAAALSARDVEAADDPEDKKASGGAPPGLARGGACNEIPYIC